MNGALSLVGVDVIGKEDAEMAADTGHRRCADVPGLLGLQIDIQHRDARDLAEILGEQAGDRLREHVGGFLRQAGLVQGQAHECTNGIVFLFPYGGQPANWSG